MRKLVLGMLGSVILALPGLASAVPMSWTYSGTCSWGNCDDIPSITGSLWADPEASGPSDEINQVAIFGDLIGYSFSVGGYSFSGSAGVGTYFLDAAGNIIGGSMTFANLFQLEFLDVGAHWTIVDTDCFFLLCGVNTAGGTGSYTNDNPTSVPEPATLGLFGLGLLGFAAARRRKA